MSGHSKWHNIQAHKGKQDKIRANAFTKIGRMIMVAARQSGGDPTMNFSLRLALEKAKEVNLPKDNIDRAIKKGTGELQGEALEEILYEGFGPGGVAVLVEAVTDNKNRMAGDVKHLFAGHGGSLAGPGSVQWQFVRLGVVRLDESQKSKVKSLKSDFELKLIDAGAEDIIESEFGVEIRSSVPHFQKVMEAVQSFDLKPDEAGLEWVAKETIAPPAEAVDRMHALYEALDGHDDVRAVYTNEA